jgi:hypothetical protein
MSDQVSGRRAFARAGEEEEIPEGRMVVEVRHCVTYILDEATGETVPAPGQGVTFPPSPPEVVNVPQISGTGDVGAMLNCNTGQWNGEPTAYDYRWATDGVLNTGIEADYVVSDDDAGKSVTCSVTATNEGGHATAPPSNAITIAAPIAEGTRSAPPVNQARMRRSEPVPSAPVAENVANV